MMSSKSGKSAVCLSPGEKKPGWHQCYLELEPTCRINSPEVQTRLHFTCGSAHWSWSVWKGKGCHAGDVGMGSAI